MGNYTKKPPKFSYSKINTYDSCSWKYYLSYKQGIFLFTDSLASELGTTVHKVEQLMFDDLKAGKQIDYDYYKEYLKNIKIDKKDKFDTEGGIYGLNILKEKYKEDFYKVDDNGNSYYKTMLDYLSTGIYRLENYLKANPDLEPFKAEKFFSIEYKGCTLSGFIDRIFYNKATGEYIVEDIKTKNKPFKDTELITPMQFVIYSHALNQSLDIPLDKIKCVYDLPMVGIRQEAGTKGFVARGLKKLDKLFDGINAENWQPNPSPLCYWCPYSPTNPDQPEGGKNLCPYYSLWTRTSKTHDVANKWEGMEKHQEIMEKEIDKNNKKQKNGADAFDFDF